MSEERDRYYADEETYRTQGRGGEAHTFEVKTLRYSDGVVVGLDSFDAPDLGMNISEAQAKGLLEWLSSRYPAHDAAVAAKAWAEGYGTGVHDERMAADYNAGTTWGVEPARVNPYEREEAEASE